MNNCQCHRFELEEYQSLDLAGGAFGLKGENLEEAVSVLQRLVEVERNPSGTPFRLRSDRRVGVIESHGIRVQVTPRYSANMFTQLLRYALGGDIGGNHRSSQNLTWSDGFESVLCRLFAHELDAIRQRGLSRKYEERVSPERALRGRIVWERNYPWRGAKAREITCRHHELTCDTLDNRLIVAGLESAMRLSALTERSALNNHYAAFSELARSMFPSPSNFEQASLQYTRLTEHYRLAHGLAQQLCLSMRPEDILQQGSELSCGVVVDMAEVFERFLFRLLNEALGEGGWEVRYQPKHPDAFLDAEGYKYAEARPDIEIWRDGMPVAVLDAKYKPYGETTPEGAPKRKVSNADLYQVLFYQQRLAREYNLPSPPRAIIVAPGNERDEVSLRNRYRSITFNAAGVDQARVDLNLLPMEQIIEQVGNKNETCKLISCLSLCLAP